MAEMKKPSHRQELRGHLLQSFIPLDWVRRTCRCAQDLMPVLRSPWSFEMKAWTSGHLNLMHLTWAGLEDTIPPTGIWVLLKHTPTAQNVQKHLLCWLGQQNCKQYKRIVSEKCLPPIPDCQSLSCLSRSDCCYQFLVHSFWIWTWVHGSCL